MASLLPCPPRAGMASQVPILHRCPESPVRRAPGTTEVTPGDAGFLPAVPRETHVLTGASQQDSQTQLWGSKPVSGSAWEAKLGQRGR